MKEYNLLRSSLAAFVLMLLAHERSAAQSYQPEITNAFIANRVIDTSKPVGVIEGSAAVTPRGSATYSIAISVPPGTNGVQPSLAVVYDSQRGDGMLGWGWGLAGLSAISRTGQDWYHDSYARGISFSSADRFAIDGQRLVQLSGGSYGANGATYDTEVAAFNSYTSWGTLGNGPERFSVITQDGTYMEYGATADSRVMGDNGNSVISWRLNKVKDPNGNYINYTYDSYDSESRLVRIDYTGNDNIGLAPYNRIEFTYQARADKNEIFIRGLGGPKTSNLLTSIRVICEGAVMKTYNFNYALRDIDKSYLREIEEVGADGAGLHTTIIKYGDPVDPPFEVEYSSAVQGTGHDFFSGDYDGDGKSEILTSAYAYSENGMRYNYDLQVYKRVGPNNLQLTWSTALDPNMQVINDQNTPHTYTANVSNDMNGDGRDDLVLGKVTKVGVYYRFQHFNVLESNSSNATSFASNVYGAPTVGLEVFDVVYPSTFKYQLAGDFNGDGKGDVLAFLSNGSYYHGFMYSPWAGITGQLLGIQNGAADLTKSSYLIPFDFDGDGAHEILSVWGDLSMQQNTRIYKWRTTPVPGFDIVWSSNGFPAPGHHLFPGDFNGDGKTDLLNTYNESDFWEITYSTGDGFYSIPFSQFNAEVELGGTPDILSVADLNGDGYSDICHGRNVGGGSSSILDVFHFRGTNSTFEETNYAHDGSLGLSPALITDVNGDGRSEVINTTNIFNPIEIFFFDRDGQERLAHKVVNGMGASRQFDYGYMTDPAVHERGTSFSYPAGDAQLPLALVKESRFTNGLGSMNAVTYSYGTAMLNRTGRGFVGFKRASSADPITNRITIDHFGVQSDYAELYPASSQAYRFDEPGSLISNKLSAFAYDPIGIPALRRHLIREVSSSIYDALAATTTTTVNTAWNTCGKVTATTTDVAGVETIATATTYVAAGPSSQPVKPQQITVTRTRNGQPAVVKATTYQYQPSSGRPEVITEFAGTSAPVSTSYEYDVVGTVKTRRLSSPAISASQHPQDKYRYDSKHRFVNQSTRVWNDGGNLIDVDTYITTDPRWGRPIEVLSSDGLTSLREYDSFGRLTRVHVPHIAGTPRYSIDLSRIWAVDGALEFTLLRATDPGGPDTEVHFDVLGRAVRTVQESFGHETVTATSNFDLRGNLALETTAHKNGEPFLEIEHLYDAYNRPLQIINPLTGTQEYGYDHTGGDLAVKVTNTSSGRWNSTVTDPSGKRIKAQDDGGELKYTYDSWGNVIRVYHDGQLTLKNRYNEFGRQTELWAPNAGTTRYTYDPFSRLIWQQNANGHETSLAYDNIGRVIERVAPEGSTAYTYFNENGRINDNISTVVGPTVDRTYYYNDPYNRLSRITSQIAGELYDTEYDYDDYDRVVTTTYPSALEVYNEYDADGSLKKVSWNEGPLFDGSSKNGLGQYTEFELGDGTSVSKEYQHGFLTRISGGAIQDLHMDYDYSTGNMLSRWDAQKFRKEMFEYDMLGRLTSSAVIGVDANGDPTGFGFDPAEYVYDGNIGSTKGNLTERTDIGQLGYGNNAVVAAKNIDYPTPCDQPPLVISLETQDITYTPFLKAEHIKETVGGDSYELAYEYGPEYERTRSVLTKNGVIETTRVYVNGFEKQSTNGQVEQIHYIAGGDGLCAIMVNTNGEWKVYSTYLDHLGSIVSVTDVDDGSVVAEQNFDPWGRHRKPTTWSPNHTPSLPSWLYRGYTGHEHADPFSLINMNGRMYDPNTGRMLSVDNFVNGSSATQAYNRFSYAANDPLTYSDPSGNIVWAPIIVGAIIGAYSGGVMSNGGEFNPTQWDFSAGSTWKYMIGGAIIGGLSGAAGYAIASSGMPAANTAALVAGSYTNSFGMHILSGGQTPVSVSFGVGSYDFNSGKVGYLGNPENSAMETVAYSLGTLANAGDVLAGVHPSDVQLNTEHSNGIGHSAITEVGETRKISSLVSVGPGEELYKSQFFNPVKFYQGNNAWSNHIGDPSVWETVVTGVNRHRIASYGTSHGKVYNLYMSSCVNHTARALTLSGVPAVGIHPFLLHAQMAARSIFLRPSLLSYYPLQW